MIDIGAVFTALETGAKVASYLGLIETVDDKIDRLISSELKTGLYLLRQAQEATAETDELVRQARDHLAKAIHVEKEPIRIIHAHLGIALAHNILGEPVLVRRSLEEALEVATAATTTDDVLPEVALGFDMGAHEVLRGVDFVLGTHLARSRERKKKQKRRRMLSYRDGISRCLASM